MSTAKSGDKVTVHYTGKLADGTIFDSTVGEEPLVFTLGEEDFIDGFVQGVMDMAVGEKKTVTVGPELAYGEREDDCVIEIPRSEIPDEMDLEVGDELELTGEEEDETMLVSVVKFTDESIILDGNPPLAGETLTFDLELVAIG